jgi:hypothetical protein
MYLGNCTAECGPTSLIYGECHYLLSSGDQMSTENWTYAYGGTGALELDCAIHSIRIGAGQRTVAQPGRRLGEYLGTGDPNAEGEVGVNVEVSKHVR